ncbi:YceD family protein [Kingella negevensis]|uniref:YceD family protein n=1 Tax=Kingella negevensis TaxID=1522312 RepID=UPI002542AAD0|nr:YceD family protein [Kingella negevensis]WII93995.1 YceD family protein [Kingella negevensis]
MLNRILIDPQAFAIKQESLQGKVSLNDLDERVWSHDFTELSSELAYTLKGGVDRWQRLFLTLSLSGCLPLQCQRCMKPVDFALDENVRIVLFETEESLDEAMLADEELEGMLLEAELDVFSLIEDQILMALPFSPKHEQCGSTDLDAVNQDKPNPFAVLAGLKKSD